MNKATHQEIRRLMRHCGVWDYTVCARVYTTHEFIKLFGDKMSDKLKDLLNKHVSRLQAYFDERILEPI